MKHLLRILLGVPTVILILMLHGNSFGGVLTGALIAIVCTAGIGLVIIIPAVYIAGILPQLACAALFAKPAAANTTRNHVTIKLGKEKLRKSSPAIADYIAKAAGAGLSKEQIVANLLNAGWHGASIEKAYNEQETAFLKPRF